MALLIWAPFTAVVKSTLMICKLALSSAHAAQCNYYNTKHKFCQKDVAQMCCHPLYQPLSRCTGTQTGLFNALYLEGVAKVPWLPRFY